MREQLCAEPDGKICPPPDGQKSRLVNPSVSRYASTDRAAQTSILQLTGIQRAQAYQNISHQSPVNATKL